MGAGRSGKAGACWRGSTKDKGFAERSAPTKTPAGREKPGRVGVARRRTKALRRSRRQQRRRQVGKSRGVLAWLDEGQRLCGEVGANKDAGRSGKAGACWRGSTKDKGFAERSAPTWAPAGREKPGRVGVARRRTKALRRGRRQQRRRQIGKSRGVLARTDEEQKKNTEQLNHCSVEVTFFLHQHHLTKNYPDTTSADGSSPAGSPQTPSSPGSSTCSSGESAGSTSASPAFPYR